MVVIMARVSVVYFTRTLSRPHLRWKVLLFLDERLRPTASKELEWDSCNTKEICVLLWWTGLPNHLTSLHWPCGNRVLSPRAARALVLPTVSWFFRHSRTSAECHTLVNRVFLWDETCLGLPPSWHHSSPNHFYVTTHHISPTWN